MSLPNDIIQSIIQFAPFSTQLQINHESRSNAISVIAPFRIKIRRAITNYLLDKKKFFWEIEEPNKAQIKRFYPMIYRDYFINYAVEILENSEVYNFEEGPVTYNAILNIREKPTIDGFNFIVDLLNEEELFSIGW
jgi:hypothetical protein